jgi:6-phosphogluconolactonase (cycloisomerase 2 family)
MTNPYSPHAPLPADSRDSRANKLRQVVRMGLAVVTAWALASCGGGGGDGGPAPTPTPAPVLDGYFIFYPSQNQGIFVSEQPNSYRLGKEVARNVVTGKYPIDSTFALIDGKKSCSYVANQNSNDLSTFTFYTDITLPVTLPRIAAGASPSGVGMDPNQAHRYVYATNFGDDTVSRYRYEPSTCQLTALGTSPTRTSPSQVRVFGKFAVIASYDNTLQVYEINLNDGSLSALGTPVATGNGPYYLFTTGVNGQSILLHTANELGNSIGGFVLDSQTGALSANGSEISVGTQPQYLASLNLPGNVFMIYVLNRKSGTISTLRYDSTAQQYVKQGVDVATRINPFRLTLSPSKINRSRYLYAYHDDPNTISAYEIDQSTGALKALGSAL